MLELIKSYINAAFHRPIDIKDVYVERIINFFVEFARHCNDSILERETSSVLEEIFYHILKLCTLGHDAYRYWGCKALGKILRELDTINQKLSDKITEIMMQRLNELKFQIRYEAILVLVPLQNPIDSPDPVIESFLRLVNTDSNYKVICYHCYALINYLFLDSPVDYAEIGTFVCCCPLRNSRVTRHQR